MAGTQYNIFCRYLNKKTNQAVTNQTATQWMNAEDYNNLVEFYNKNKTYYEVLKDIYINGGARKKSIEADGIEWASGTYKEWYETNNDGSKKHPFGRETEGNPWFIGKAAYDAFAPFEQEIYNQCEKYLETQDLLKNNKIVIEMCRIEPADSSGEKTKESMQREIDTYNEILEQSYVKNPKFDMVFAFDGIAKVMADFADYAELSGTVKDEDLKQKPYVYYDKMRRFELAPWFFYSAHYSLESAMVKAEELVNMFGKDAICICKVVPLDQYIDIV